MQLDGAGYAWMTQRLLQTLRRGPSHRVGFLLEGGYDLAGLRESVRDTLGALEAPAAGAPSGFGPPNPRHEAQIAAAVRTQRVFWTLT